LATTLAFGFELEQGDQTALFKKKATSSEAANVLCQLTFSINYNSLFEQIDQERKKLRSNIKDTMTRETAVYEFMTLQMFSTTTAVREILDDAISAQVLDMFHTCVAKKGCKTERRLALFQAHLNERYQNYNDALRNQSGGGPMWHLGRVLIKNSFVDDPGDLIGPALACSLFVEWRKAVMDLLSDYKVTRQLPTDALHLNFL
jgi:hypothetical protein